MINIANRFKWLKTTVIACQLIFWIILLVGFTGAWYNEIMRKNEEKRGKTPKGAS